MTRPLIQEIYMRFAVNLAERSTCTRAKVGAVITSPDFEQVLALGYNGNAKGRPNQCDTAEPGACGCIHAESNALIKCGKQRTDKVLFTTHTPCVMCAKMIVNSGFSKVYYNQIYRRVEGWQILMDAKIVTDHIKLT
jgi:dCMP deaminase